jgi:hypothetical protein
MAGRPGFNAFLTFFLWLDKAQSVGNQKFNLVMALTYNNRNTASEFLHHDYLSVHVKGNEVFKTHGETGSCFDKTQSLKETKWRLQRPGGACSFDHSISPKGINSTDNFRAWSTKAIFPPSPGLRQRTSI